MTEEDSLRDFLLNAGLSHLVEYMLEEGMTLDMLLQANQTELALFTTKIVDRIKLRSAIDVHRSKNTTQLIEDQTNTEIPGQPDTVALLHRSNIIYVKNDEDLASSSLLTVPVPFEIPNDEILLTPNEQQNISHANVRQSSFLQSQGFSISQQLELLEEIGSTNSLRDLLSKDSTGKCILQKSVIGKNLNTHDRAIIVKLIVEKELQQLDKINDTIRKNIWLQWTKEIVELFKGECSEVYYVPYHILGGKVVQASGLIHNRLITHRRSLTPESLKRKGSSSEHSDSSGSSSKSNCKIKLSRRIRPLPDEFIDEGDVDESSLLDEDLDWLRGSSSPYEIVIAKWRNTLNLRTKLLETHSYNEYFNQFPALKLPNGYELLASDFDAVYPSASETYANKFSIIKLKLLKLLTAKGEMVNVCKPILDLLELASVGEEQANLASFLAIVILLRQMPTVTVPRKKCGNCREKRSELALLDSFPLLQTLEDTAKIG